MGEVVSLSKKREEKPKKENSETDFKKIMEENEAKKKKLKQERDKENAAVKRSYRLTK